MKQECNMNENSNVSLNKSSDPTTVSKGDRIKFNWAAFLMPPIWLLGHQYWVWGLGYVITMVAAAHTKVEVSLLINLLQICFGIFLGARGNSMLWKTGRYRSIGELYRREKPWTNFALISFLVLLGLLLVVGFWP